MLIQNIFYTKQYLNFEEESEHKKINEFIVTNKEGDFAFYRDPKKEGINKY